MKLDELLCEDESPKDLAVLRDMLTRVNPQKVRAWALENNWDEDDMDTEDGFLWVFANWLEQEHSLRVNDGIVEFWRLDHPIIERMIGDHPVLLYHFTSSARVPSIRKHGLVSGRRSVNRTETEGVYLTTETSGPAIRGYLYGALRGTRKAYGVRLDIRTYLNELQSDPDDEDITSGATQFMTNYVAPEQIIGVNRA